MTVTRQRCALAHHAHHVEWRQPLDDGVLIGEVIGEDGDLGARRHLRPVGHAQRDVLVIVEDRDRIVPMSHTWFGPRTGPGNHPDAKQHDTKSYKREQKRMGAHDKVSNKIDDVAGKAKEGRGKATGDRSTENEGKLDQAKSSLKDAGEKVKDAFKK